MKKTTLFMSMLLFVCLVFSFAGNRHVADEIIVKFDASMSKAGQAAIQAQFGLQKKAESYKPGAFVVFKTGNVEAALERLNKKEGVVYAERNGIATINMVPNDPYYNGYQWNMDRIGMPAAWDINTGSGVTVAVLDSGVKQSVDDLAGTSFTAGYDFINNDNDPTDDHQHGTHVAGTIAQTTNNSIGCAGVAFDATIMPVKVLNRRGSGSYSAIANGIYFATDNGADVINMSLGGPSNDATLQAACDYAWNNGVVVVVAAGNESTSAPSYPAAYSVCISVSATNYLDQLAGYSNYGSTIDICAPGGDGNDFNGDGYIDGILQNTFDKGPSNGYYFMYGTSMACPHVAGVAALLKSQNPSRTNAQIRSILESTATDLGSSGWDQYFGHGMVNAAAAL